jgi:hypothetical protein
MNNATTISQSIESQLLALENQKNGNMMNDLEIEDQIRDLKLQAGLAKRPEHSQFECFGCGS